MSAVEARSREVDSLLGGRQYLKAVVAALRDPPYGESDNLKALNFDTVMRALAAPQEKEIPDIVKQICNGSASDDLADNLMKYIYRGLQEERNNGGLLKWHSAVVSEAGSGCIMRAMASRKAL